MSDFSRLRQSAGLSIQDVADRTGYGLRTIYRWENGEAAPRRAVIECLQRAIQQPDAARTDFTFIDLFAGIGGLRRGFETIGGRCVFTSEWNKYSQETYRANFGQEEIHGDITKVEAADIPAHDMLLAGFPCQPFSIAGVSKKNALNRPHGFHCDAQGTLFFDVARIIEHHRPRAFLLENVKNLVNHDRGNTFAVIHRTLTEELGYKVSWKVIDARSWVPQHRERIFIAGFRDDVPGFSFDDFKVPDPFAGPRLGSILHSSADDGPDPRFADPATGEALGKYTLTQHLWGYLQGYAEKHRQKGNGFGFGLNRPEDVARTLSARYYKDGSEILIQQEGKSPRRLTPRECARLMGFEKPGGCAFKIPVSDTQAYKQFGNAVVVPVIEAVARHMAPWIVPAIPEDEREVA